MKEKHRHKWILVHSNSLCGSKISWCTECGTVRKRIWRDGKVAFIYMRIKEEGDEKNWVFR